MLAEAFEEKAGAAAADVVAQDQASFDPLVDHRPGTVAQFGLKRGGDGSQAHGVGVDEAIPVQVGQGEHVEQHGQRAQAVEFGID